MTRREEFETENELMWNQLELQGRHSLLIGTGYKHKHDNVKFVTDLEVSLDKIEKKGKGYNIILAGDFNQANIDWKNSTVIRDHPASKSTAELLLETTTGFGLNQHVLEPTRKDSILDLVFTNNSSLVRDVKVDPGLSDHYMVITDIDLRAKWKRQPRRKYFVRRKANEDLINEELSTFKDKYFSMGNVSVQEKWDNLESEIKTVMNKHIPQKTAAKPNSLPWFKRSHHRLRRRKQRAFNKAKKSQSSDDWKKFLSCQKELKKSLNESEREFVANNLTTAMKENTKQFWSYMKRLGKSESGVADLKVNNNIISDGKEKAEALNAQFASVFTREDKEAIPTLGSSSIQDIPDLIIHEKGVLKQLQELSPNKAAGPDEIPPWFLKMFAEKLAPIFTDLFQASVDQGTLPINGGRQTFVASLKGGQSRA
ncbi:uncharacterized protein [Amphiura filiformis]|uniref:uncharacterized protein n=1 Tax=Amphiura filiformis TaxID=82378 RepID=UPI003B216AE2